MNLRDVLVGVVYSLTLVFFVVVFVLGMWMMWVLGLH
jgi:hypothetical protein